MHAKIISRVVNTSRSSIFLGVSKTHGASLLPCRRINFSTGLGLVEFIVKVDKGLIVNA